MTFAAGIKQAIYDGRSGHSLRHTMATDILRAGADIRDVYAALGRASLVNTQRVLASCGARSARGGGGGRCYRGTDR